jgi:hypothetical protein
MRRLISCLTAWIPVSRRRFDEVEGEAQRLSALLHHAAKRIAEMQQRLDEAGLGKPFKED